MASSKAPSSNSIQSYIKLISQLKPTTSTTDHFVPYHRHWVDGNTQKDIGHIIRVMTWNVLAQGLTASGPRKNYCRTPQSHLSWEYRRYLLIMEMISYMPDIIVLQECDKYDFFSRKLGEFGYKGKFHARPFSPCVDMTEDENGKPDGCAIFYQTSRFALDEVVHRELLNLMRFSTSSLAFALKLQLLEDSKPLMVVTTHLKAGDNAEKTRYEACQDLIEFIKENKDPEELIVIGADLGENPREKGHKFLMQHYKDVYNYALDGRYPPFTTWRCKPLGEERFCNDVLMFDDTQFRVLKVLDVPDSVGENRLPNTFCGSDHICLIADLQVIM